MRASISLTLKSGFLDWLRAETMESGLITKIARNKEIRACHNQLFHRFGNRMAAAQAARYASDGPSPETRVTCSLSIVKPEDWIIDTAAAMCNVTAVWWLDRYSLKYLFTLPEKSCLLLLILMNEDDVILYRLCADIE